MTRYVDSLSNYSNIYYVSIENLKIPTGLYPVIIQESRYGGTYEGGRFFCYSGSNNMPDSFFEYLHGDDDAAIDFWHGNDSHDFGVGDSPNEAFLDFLNLIHDDDAQDYKQLTLSFEAREIAELSKPARAEYVERTDYYQASQPIFSPRKNKDF